MSPFNLLNSHKQDLEGLILKYNLSISDFVWENSNLDRDTSEFFPVLRYRGTDFYFAFIFVSRRDHCYKRFPGNEGPAETGNPGRWINQLHYFDSWLQLLKIELESFDPWSSILSLESTLFDESRFEDNKPFNHTEITTIEDHINALKQDFVSFSSTHAIDIEQINAKLDYLIDSSKRNGRKDWFIQAFGILFTILNFIGGPQELIKDVGNLITEKFELILGEIIPPLL